MTLKNYNGIDYEVIKISSDFEDVSKYDSTGSCSDDQCPGRDRQPETLDV